MAGAVRGSGRLRGPAQDRHGRQHLGTRPSRCCGRQRGDQNQAIGRSRGGRTTKIHAVADQQGRIAAILLTPGQAADISGARALLAAFPAPADLIADKAYDADDLRAFLVRQGTRPVISPMPNRRAIPPFDAVAYRQRNLIERAFCRLKDWRAIATRYDKTARNFLAGGSLAATLIWWIK